MYNNKKSLRNSFRSPRATPRSHVTCLTQLICFQALHQAKAPVAAELATEGSQQISGLTLRHPWTGQGTISSSSSSSNNLLRLVGHREIKSCHKTRLRKDYAMII
ncbi:hypothetical protein PoB_006415900 [Plakobranchus ocellatus]|uniref:Uncharacterized protein n=1 Tax=Plakobranchus ocellatus TaxID=259542 RepID=A0AAV4D0Q7_9GAST|nr:hypothetical protein PoB_006415900 [Plakobranchus ocellatus]